MVLKGLTNIELARRLGCTKTWISLVINGHAKSEWVRKGIAEALGEPYEKIWEE